MSIFKKAERIQRPLKLGITGPSGSGKTYSALVLAQGLAEGKRIAVIDTENSSSSLYADRITFDTAQLEAPYTTTKYVDALRIAEKAGYAVVIIDSLSHEWAGSGGLLEKKTALDSRGGNSFTNWSGISKEHESFISAIVSSKMDLIVTMRSKADYVLAENDKGKLAPKKVGLAPIQREGVEFELDLVFDLSMDHSYQVSKDRTGLFDGRIERITEKTAATLLEWRRGGAVSTEEVKEPTPLVTEPLPPIKAGNPIVNLINELGITPMEATQLARDKFNVQLVKNLKEDEMPKFIEALHEYAASKKVAV